MCANRSALSAPLSAPSATRNTPGCWAGRGHSSAVRRSLFRGP
ncbi:hypothetical protein RC1_3752 [Rhodospirillum centenum SW]|uniref:Uncharacterized protein n=1 Tax=Rhodospirillum centenum (strain ATCC 51521 / SW) TaxID=414684 RepID=B6IXS1_RHOCS|nr:hypothetical protein RC1_3752 [Rhodospirillum centenum SW]